MKLYAVELTTTAVVIANSEADAWRVVRDNIRDMHGVTKISELPNGRGGMRIPYGYDGNTRIREILEEEASRC